VDEVHSVRRPVDTATEAGKDSDDDDDDDDDDDAECCEVATTARQHDEYTRRRLTTFQRPQQLHIRSTA